MAKLIFKLSEVSKDEWLLRRGVGSSDTAAVLGLASYATPFQVFARITGLVKPETLQGEWLEWGNILEPVIATEGGKRLGFAVVKNDFFLAHEEHEWLTTTVDFWRGSEHPTIENLQQAEIVECKNVASRRANEWDGTIPDHVHCQVLQQLAVTGARRAHICALIGGNRLVTHVVERDERTIEKIINKLVEFKANCDNNIPPMVTGADSSFLGEVFPDSAIEGEVDLSDNAEMVSRYAEIKSEIDRLTEEKQVIESELKLKLGGYGKGRGDGFSVSWKSQFRSSVDLKSLAQLYPSLIEHHTKLNAIRVFRITDNRGKKDGQN